MSSYQWLLEWEGIRGILGQWKYSVAAHPYTLVQTQRMCTTRSVLWCGLRAGSVCVCQCRIVRVAKYLSRRC